MIVSGAEKLYHLHPDLVAVVRLVGERMDIAVLETVRSKEAQNAAFDRGASKLRWPDGKHCVREPEDKAEAVDLAPAPVRWPDEKGIGGIARVKRYTAFGVLAGHMRAAAAQLGVDIRWGGDWDRDGDTEDQSFDDLPHFERVSEAKP